MSNVIRRTKILTILLLATPLSVAQVAPKNSCRPASTPALKAVQPQPPYLHQGPIELHCGSQTVALAPSVSEQSPKKDSLESTTLQWMEGLSKISSSLAWPLFGLIVLLTFRRQFAELIGRIKSIELGKNKVVLDTQLRPMPAPQQAAKSREENKDTDEGSSTSLPANMRASPQSRYLLAEDLALRALQEEYGASIRRQVTAGADPGFDGAFVIDNRLYIVEVKYYRSSFIPNKLQSSIFSLADSINRYGWSNVQIILAAVFDELDDAYTKTVRLSSAVSTSIVPVIVRTFSMAELNARFGVPPNIDG